MLSTWTNETEPPALVKPELCLTQLTLYLDVNIIGDVAPATAALRRARTEGWVRLQRADTMETELLGSPAEKAPQLLDEARQLVESLGPLVLGHSRLGTSVLASREDAMRHEAVFKLLYPNAEYATAKRNDIRDAMHVHTAIRYGGSGFVSRDKRILGRDAAFVEAFNYFRLLTPEAALEWVRTEALSCLRLRRAMGAKNWLPTWIPEVSAHAHGAKVTPSGET